ncbi:hypothetical protein MN608_05051 [Microdochium nivale]|nr:hypothetical protein MN608_05051 [Microdochium nivale]
MVGKRIPDPRVLLPSKADPEHRSLRKELEKNHGLGYKEPLVLGLIAMGLVWNMDQQVKKYEERKDQKESARDNNKNNDGEDDDRRSTRRARSSRRAPPPPPASVSSSSRRGGGGGGGEEREHHRSGRQEYDDGSRRPSQRSRGYAHDHYYHDDGGGYGAADMSPRGHGARRERYYVHDTDGIPRSERRSRGGGGGGGGGDDDRRSEYTDTATWSSRRGTAVESHHSGSLRPGEQYDDGFEKKRFDSMPMDPLLQERRYHRSRRDSW